MSKQRDAFLAFLNSIECLPVTVRPRQISPAKLRFLLNWTALILARCFDVHDVEEFNELRRKMEFFTAGFVNTGFGE